MYIKPINIINIVLCYYKYCFKDINYAPKLFNSYANANHQTFDFLAPVKWIVGNDTKVIGSYQTLQ